MKIMAKEEEKYNHLEKVLQDVIAKYIAIDPEEERRNNMILKTFLDGIVENMKSDRFFEELYRDNFYGGSYYNGLKITKPDEYDLDFVIELPEVTRPKLFTSVEFPEYVQMHLENLYEYEEQDYAIPGFAKQFLDDNHYLSSKKVLHWTKSIINSALDKFPSKMIHTEYGIFHFKTRGGDPAFTIELIDAANEQLKMSIDLVVSFVLTDKYWPGPPFRQNEVKEKNEFFLVPQQADPSTKKDLSRYWRFSFPLQERSLIDGHRNLKPALKLIKRLRDMYDHKYVCTYYLKTIFLWEAHDKALWDKPLSYVFVKMLRRYKEALEKRRIDYYWDETDNLLKQSNREILCKFAKDMQNVIEDIENYPEDPVRILRHMVKAVPEPAFGCGGNIGENLDLKVSDETTTD